MALKFAAQRVCSRELIVCELRVSFLGGGQEGGTSCSCRTLSSSGAASGL